MRTLAAALLLATMIGGTQTTDWVSTPDIDSVYFDVSMWQRALVGAVTKRQ